MLPTKLRLGSCRIRAAARALIALLALQPLLQGCGGGSAGTTAASTAHDITTAATNGTLARAEIGGDGLTLVSCWQAKAPVSANGGFSTQVSQEGAQILCVTDAAKQPRALTISVPASRGRQAQPLVVDARSTALATLWISPGVVETDPSLAPARLAELEALPSFPALVAYLRGVLPTATLNDIQGRAEFAGLAGQCLEEWMAQRRSRMIEIDPTARGAVTMRVAGQDDLTKVALQFQNGGYRWVFVHRKGFHADGSVADIAKVGAVDGARPASWGALFEHGVIGTPGTKSDTVNFAMDSGGCDFWLHGLGTSAGSETPPADLAAEDSDDTREWLIKPLWAYAAAPVIDAVMGAADLVEASGGTPGHLWEANSTVWGWVQVTGAGADAAAELQNANGDPAATRVAVYDFLKEVFSQIASLAKALQAAGYLSAGAAAGLIEYVVTLGGIATASVAAVVAVFNIVALADTLCSQPAWTHLEVRTSGDLGIQIRSRGSGGAAPKGGRP